MKKALSVQIDATPTVKLRKSEGLELSSVELIRSDQAFFLQARYCQNGTHTSLVLGDSELHEIHLRIHRTKVLYLV